MSNCKKPDKPAIEFQNEWAQIERAVTALASFDPYNNDYGEIDCYSKHMNDAAEEAIDALVKHVPKLMKAYEDLYEMSQALADDYERLAKKNQGLVLPSGLVLPK